MLSSWTRPTLVREWLALGASAAVIAVAAIATPSSRAIAQETSAAFSGVAILAFLTLCLFGIVELLDRWWQLDREWTRKLAHVGVGFIALLAPLLFRTPWPMLVLTASFAGLLLVSRRLGILEPLHPEGRPGAGDLTYAAGVYAAFALTDDARTFQIAVLVLALADPAAALVGRARGHRRFRAFSATRSLEGSLAFAIVALGIGILLGPAGLLLREVLGLAVALAAVTAIAEATSPPGLDNLTIPLAAILVLRLL